MFRFLTGGITCLAAAAVVFLLTGQGSGGSLFTGIPDERVAHLNLRLAGDTTPAITRGQAIASAIRDGAIRAPGGNARVREALLVWQKDITLSLPQERLVWAINFDDPSAVLGGRYQPQGPFGIPHEALFAIVLIDATTGEHVMTAEGWKRVEGATPAIPDLGGQATPSAPLDPSVPVPSLPPIPAR